MYSLSAVVQQFFDHFATQEKLELKRIFGHVNALNPNACIVDSINIECPEAAKNIAHFLNGLLNETYVYIHEIVKKGRNLSDIEDHEFDFLEHEARFFDVRPITHQGGDDGYFIATNNPKFIKENAHHFKSYFLNKINSILMEISKEDDGQVNLGVFPVSTKDGLLDFFDLCLDFSAEKYPDLYRVDFILNKFCSEFKDIDGTDVFEIILPPEYFNAVIAGIGLSEETMNKILDSSPSFEGRDVPSNVPYGRTLH